MGTVRVKLTIAGFNAIRNSEEVVGLLEDIGQDIMSRANTATRFHNEAGDPFKMNTVHNRTRAVTFVSTANIDGILAEVYDRALSKGIG